VIAHAGKILDPAPADENHGVLVEVVALSRNVCCNLETVPKPYTGHLAEG
jgi:hypothetical protein